jgi:hypothetical protein
MPSIRKHAGGEGFGATLKSFDLDVVCSVCGNVDNVSPNLGQLKQLFKSGSVSFIDDEGNTTLDEFDPDFEWVKGQYDHECTSCSGITTIHAAVHKDGGTCISNESLPNDSAWYIVEEE